MILQNHLSLNTNINIKLQFWLVINLLVNCYVFKLENGVNEYESDWLKKIIRQLQIQSKVLCQNLCEIIRK